MRAIVKLFIGFIKTLIFIPLQPLIFFFNPERFSSKHLLRFLIGISVIEILFLFLAGLGLWSAQSEFRQIDTTLVREYLDSQWSAATRVDFQQSLPVRFAARTFPEPTDTPYQLIPSKVVIDFCDSIETSLAENSGSNNEIQEHLRHAKRHWKRALAQQKDSIQKTAAYQKFTHDNPQKKYPTTSRGAFPRPNFYGIWLLLLIPVAAFGLYFNLSCARLLWSLPEIYFAKIPAFYEFAKISAPIIGFIRWSFLFLYLLLILNIIIGIISLISILIGSMVILLFAIIIGTIVIATLGLILLSDNFTPGKVFGEVWEWATFPLQFFKGEENLLKSLGMNPELAILMQVTFVIVFPAILCYWILKRRNALQDFIEQHKNELLG